MPARPRIIYFHGMPGSPRELALFGERRATRSLHAPDRTQSGAGSAADLDAMAANIGTRFPKGRVHIVAFSLGARPALEVAARLGARVASVDLVSPAAPPGGGIGRDVAGAPVFALAARSPRLFGLLVGAQSVAARQIPALLARALFASATGADRALIERPQFAATMQAILADCFASGGGGYRTELPAYVAPWSDVLARVTKPVTLWHGTADNWAPTAMTDALAAALPNIVAVHRLAGLSHYSTLEAALRAILPAAGR